MRVRLCGVALLCLCLIVGTVGETAAVSVGPVTGDGNDAGLLALRPADRRILAGLPTTTTVAVHARTGRVRFLGGSLSRPVMTARALRRAARSAGLARQSSTPAGGDTPLAPALAARVFLSRTASLFGVTDPARRPDP